MQACKYTLSETWLWEKAYEERLGDTFDKLLRSSFTANLHGKQSNFTEGNDSVRPMPRVCEEAGNEASPEGALPDAPSALPLQRLQLFVSSI